MYKVIDSEGHVRGKSKDLNIAMEMAKLIDEFVIIKGDNFEVCGKFGVDEVKDPNYNGWISRKKGD
jgi:hypothetical protein